MILQGHILDKLPEIASESVHCVVTSPPYWGLRDYGLPPQVWDGVEGCGHVWGDTTIINSRHLPEDDPTPKQATNVGSHQRGIRPGACCLKCNAWRGSLGLEPTPELYLQHIVEVFREIRRVLRKDGTVWLNMGDSYAANRSYQVTDNKHINVGNTKGSSVPSGLKPKDLCGIPWRLALALQADGWWLRSDIIWAKPNPMPESVTDRPTRAHEYIFLLTKAARYYYDTEAVRERAQSGPSDLKKMAEKKDRIGGKHKTLVDPLNKASSTTHIGRKRSVGGTPLKQDALGKNTYTGFNERYAENPVSGRNLRSVWNIATQAFPGAHFATFPELLVQRCIMAGTSERGACPECGAPWERVVERKFCPQNDVSQDKGIRGHDGQKPMDASSGLQGTPRGNNDTQTLGWRPTCECGGEPVPCVVLDPFIGSGTVGKVAQALGRDWIGIELNPDYCDMAEKRTMHRQELLRLG